MLSRVRNLNFSPFVVLASAIVAELIASTYFADHVFWIAGMGALLAIMLAVSEGMMRSWLSLAWIFLAAFFATGSWQSMNFVPVLLVVGGVFFFKSLHYDKNASWLVIAVTIAIAIAAMINVSSFFAALFYIMAGGIVYTAPQTKDEREFGLPEWIITEALAEYRRNSTIKTVIATALFVIGMADIQNGNMFSHTLGNLVVSVGSSEWFRLAAVPALTISTATTFVWSLIRGRR